MNRRDFFGIIASPLIRHVGPPPIPVSDFGRLLADVVLSQVQCYYGPAPAPMASASYILPPGAYVSYFDMKTGHQRDITESEANRIVRAHLRKQLRTA